MTTRRRIEQFSRIADFAVLEPNGAFFIFGTDTNINVVVYGQHSQRITKRTFQSLNGRAAPTREQKQRLTKHAEMAWNISPGQSIGRFSIDASLQTFMRKEIKNTRPTHLEFFSDGALGKVFCFDVRAMDGSVLYQPHFLANTKGFKVSDVGGLPFSFSMKAATFIALPNEPFDCEIYESGLARLIAAKDGIAIYTRDQELRKPFTRFFSDQLGKDIAFLFHPKS